MAARGKDMANARVVIVGGGAAAAWLVMALLRRGVDGIDVVEPRGEIGRGLAYSTVFAGHLLNVPADKMDMNAEPGDPLFSRWLAGIAPQYLPHGYAPRGLYGDFLTAAFRTAIAGRDVRHCRAGVAAIAATADGFEVTHTEGTLAARAVILALGNLPPRRLGAAVCDPRIEEDPWAIAPHGRTGQRVLVAGTGLTAMDAVLSIDRADPAAQFTLCAGHAFLPPVDAIVVPWGEGVSLIGSSPATAWRRLRATLRTADPVDGWYGVIDGVRPHVEAIWRAWSRDEKLSFWRHGARHWLHRRHRAAPGTRDAIDRLIAGGRLSLAPGRVTALRVEPDAIAARVGPAEHRADLVVNATGPSLSLRSHNVLSALADARLITADPTGLGIAATAGSQLIGADGAPVAGLYALGALTRGTFFEIVAIPHIRRKAALIAGDIAAVLG